MFSLQKSPACACEDDEGDLFTSPVSLRNEGRLQILQSGGLTAGPGGAAAQGEVLALV